MPPVAGPDSGPAPVTVAVAAYENAAPSAVKSAPFALTSTVTGPLASAGGASHSSSVAFTQRAAAVVRAEAARQEARVGEPEAPDHDGGAALDARARGLQRQHLGPRHVPEPRRARVGVDAVDARADGQRARARRRRAPDLRVGDDRRRRRGVAEEARRHAAESRARQRDERAGEAERRRDAVHDGRGLVGEARRDVDEVLAVAAHREGVGPASPGGAAHRTSASLTNVAGTSVQPKRHLRRVEKAKPDPSMETTVPPPAGPELG